MKTVEERLRELPEIAETCGIEADERLKRRILRAADDAGRKAAPRRRAWIPVACAAVLALALILAYPALKGRDPVLITSQPAGEGAEKGEGALTGDVRGGSVTITSGQVPAYQSIWASGSSGNFPLVAVNGQYYRLLSSPGKISSSLLGSQIGTIGERTDEPALCRAAVFSNVVDLGQPVYAVTGMDGAAAAAYVDGTLRVFQRTSFSGSAILGRESLGDTLKLSNVTSIELTDVGTVTGDEAARLADILLKSASYQNANCSETGKTLVIRCGNGISMQLCVNGDSVSGCGTWSCPDFFEAFPAAEKP